MILKNFEADILRNLDKKANVSEINNLLAMKGDLNHALNLIENKANLSDVESLKTAVDDLNKDLIDKIDYDKFNSFISDTRMALDDFQKDLLMKANIKETLNLLKNKPDINDVNTSITKITEELDQKCSLDKVIFEIKIILNLLLIIKSSMLLWIIKRLLTTLYVLKIA